MLDAIYALPGGRSMLGDGILRLSGQTHKTVFLGAGDGPVVVADPALVFGAEFARVGKDLILRNDDGADVHIVDYFHSDTPPDLVVPDGATLRGDVVARLAGPEAAGQYAQAGAVDAGVPIGQVEQVGGAARVQRVDGTSEPLTPSSKIFMGDVVQTDDGGSLSITFVDGTIFSLNANSRMVIDSLIYSPASTENSATFNLVQGGFIFIAGQVAKTGGMEVTTPAATMGIRGTTVLADVQTQAGVSTVEVTLTRDPDGNIGRVELFDLDGNLITTITGTDTKWIVSTDDELTREVERTAEDENTDSVLIADAVAAFTQANERFSVEGRFVDLDSVARPDVDVESDVGSEEPAAGEEQIELDSQDDEEAPELEAPPPVEEPASDSDTFDEGRLDAPLEDPPGVLEDAELDVVLTALEDSQEEEVAGQLLADIDAEVTFDLAAGPQNGAVELSSDGEFRYVPNENFNGEDRFTYQVADGVGGFETGTVTINVLPVNDDPLIDDAELTVLEDSVLQARSLAQDIDSDSLTYSLQTGAQSGSVVVTETGDWTYRPNADFDGVDSFEIRVTDGDGGFAAQRVTVTVEGTSDAPVIVIEGSATRGTLSGGRLSASGRLEAYDPDTGASLAWSGSAEGDFGSFAINAEGFWTYEGGAEAIALAEGQEATETFLATVTDDDGITSGEEVVVTIQGTNDSPVIMNVVSAPVVVSDAVSPEASGQLQANDVDNGAQLAWTGTDTSANGTFTVNATGRWSYRLNAASRSLPEGETLIETFVVQVTDEFGAMDTQEVSITVIGTNDAPVITSEVNPEPVVENTSPEVSGTLAASDIDAGAELTWSGSIDGTYGRFEIDAQGSWSYVLNAAAEELGVGDAITERFTATVTDDAGASVSQEVTITVTGSNDAPRVELVDFDVLQGGTLEANLSATDVDRSDTLIFAAGETGPSNGTVEISEDGGFIYVPNDGFAGKDVFSFTVQDASGAVTSSQATVWVSSTPIEGQAGSSASLEFSAKQGGTLLAKTTDAETTPVSVVIALQSVGFTSGSDWAAFAGAISQALETLGSQYEGASGDVSVHLVSLSSATPVVGTFALGDPALQQSLQDLPDIVGSSSWAETFTDVEAYVSAQEDGARSFLFLVADALPQNSDWVPIFEGLSETQGDDLTARVFIVGRGTEGGSLSPEDRAFTEEFLTENILSTFDATPVFAPNLVDLSVQLIVDGQDKGEVADESDLTLGADGLVSMLSLAEIPNLMTELGAENRFVVTAGYDSDGTPETAEAQLFASHEFGKFAQAVVADGTDKADLLFGSDLVDHLSGQSGNDVILGFAGDDVISTGAGRDQVSAGAGDDTLVLDDLTDAEGSVLDGGAGHDTLQLAQGVSLDANALSLIDLSGIETIDMETGDETTLTLSVEDVLSISDGGDSELETLLGTEVLHSLTVTGDAGDRLELVDAAGGSFEATGLSLETTDGAVLNVYTYVDGGSVHAALAVDSEVTVITATATT